MNNSINFAEKIEEKINEIKQKYNVNEFRLAFRSAKMILEKGEKHNFIENIFEVLLKTLELEREIIVIINSFFLKKQILF